MKMGVAKIVYRNDKWKLKAGQFLLSNAIEGENWVANMQYKSCFTDLICMCSLSAF